MLQRVANDGCNAGRRSEAYGLLGNGKRGAGMFIQIIQGKVSDADHLRRQLERWRKEIKPGAKGYLGHTGGVTADGRTIAMVRFESEADAKANSDRPEQGAW